MKKTIAVSILSACLTFVAGIAVAQRVHDWHDLEACHNHVKEAIQEMENARAANHYDMGGHGIKAEEHLRAAEQALHGALLREPRQPIAASASTSPCCARASSTSAGVRTISN